MTDRVTGPKSYFPSIEATYGRTIDAWIDLLRPLSGRAHMEQVAFVKEHGMGHGHANALVHVFRAEHDGS